MVIETASPAAFEKGGAYLARFAFATDVTVTAKYEGSTDGMVNVATPDAKGFIPMMELIDRDKELARLNKELTKAEKELGMFTNQLNNPKFVEKAPGEARRGDPRQAGCRSGQGRQDQGEHCGAGVKSLAFPLRKLSPQVTDERQHFAAARSRITWPGSLLMRPGPPSQRGEGVILTIATPPRQERYS